ncbi:MAG: nitroreductase family protein [Clostridia bacterium]|nr:nitroreductase family protein [Clostridia bacterium]
MKKLLSAVCALLLAACMVLPACANSVTDVIMTAGTTQSFTDESVNEEDLTVIVQAGLAAPSAINQQPWYFAVVTNKDIMSQLTGGGSGMPSGAAPAGMPADLAGGNIPADLPGDAAAANLPEGFTPGAAPGGMPASSGAKASLGDSAAAIIIYIDENTKSPNASFDCGLAAQNMYIAAASLGYGVKIVSAPAMNLNGADHDHFCELLGVDPSLQALAVLLIGYPENSADAVSGATTRYTIDEKVSVIN